jgi:hypothetical protein
MPASALTTLQKSPLRGSVPPQGALPIYGYQA